MAEALGTRAVKLWTRDQATSAVGTSRVDPPHGWDVIACALGVLERPRPRSWFTVARRALSQRVMMA